MGCQVRIRLRPLIPDEFVRLKSTIEALENRLQEIDRDLGQKRRRQERFALEMALRPSRVQNRLELKFDSMDRTIAELETQRNQTSARLRQLKEAANLTA